VTWRDPVSDLTARSKRRAIWRLTVETILKAAANAEIAAIMHWRSSYLVRLMHTISTSRQPQARGHAIRMHALETEAIVRDLEIGLFHTAAGKRIECHLI
jgi:hypothetical protein